MRWASTWDIMQVSDRLSLRWPVKYLLTFFSLCFSPLLAQDTGLFETHVAKVFAERCLSCHNDVDRKGDFSLQSRAEFFEAGFVEPNDAGSSYLLEIVTSQDGAKPEMPKDGEPLSADEVQAIREWIDAGADWPNEFVLQEPVVKDFDWWSYRPIQQSEIPVFADASKREWIRNPIDAFVLEKMTEQGLEPSEPADRTTLIRRLTYDLTGLPPTPEEIQAFVFDERPEAYDALVDRLLKSPRYGEHWARHWLDVVKYADTCGYDKDKLRENAWPYRDYVIKSFNSDKPYWRFIQEQIAGDVLFPGAPDGILGLGFLAAGPWDFIGHVEVPESKLDGQVARNLDRDDMVSNVLNTFCSVTIQCARCHNHKFDPFTQSHYYSLQAVFAAVDRAERVYDLSPEIQQQRSDLNVQLAKARDSLDKLHSEIDAEGGRELTELRKLVTDLKAKSQPVSKGPEFGYHSHIAASQSTAKWVQVDLGQLVQLDQVILNPCHDEFNGIGAGFGFPVSYKVEAATNIDKFATNDRATAILLQSNEDTLNPGLKPVIIDGPDVPVRFLRVTATKLAPRQNDFIFALSELQAIGPAGNNIAINCEVSALDSIEAPVRWRKTNLTDGIFPAAADPVASEQLLSAEQSLQDALAKIRTPERLQREALLTNQINDVQQKLSALPVGKMVYAAATNFPPQGNFKPTNGTPREIRRLHRGNIDQPEELVQPGTIPLRNESRVEFDLPIGHPEGERRAALAKWITSDAQPLTDRSIVNRIWQYHMDSAIVSSPNDFGKMGQLPSHPELLDWLAAEFRAQRESLKSLHRLIVTSSTYRQSSQSRPDFEAIDGSNRYYWRMNRRRLTAEEIRDSILAVSGQLDETSGGPGDQLFVIERPEHSPHYEYHLFDPETAPRHRRSIYRFVVRSQPDPWMSVLDCADSSQSTPTRSETVTALQALSLMNNRFNLVMAERFANRLRAEEMGISDQIALAMRLLTAREAQAEELATLEDYAADHGLENLCRVMLNMNEFVFVD